MKTDRHVPSWERAERQARKKKDLERGVTRDPGQRAAGEDSRGEKTATRDCFVVVVNITVFILLNPRRALAMPRD